MLDNETKELKALSDREILIKMATIQEFQTNELAVVKQQIDKIESKILEDVSHRLRKVEDKQLINDSTKKGTYSFWPVLIGFVSVVGAIVAIILSLKPTI